MNPTSWETLVDSYINHRRGLGFVMDRESTGLLRFAKLAEEERADRLTEALMVKWARQSRKQTPITWARRLDMVRGFAKYYKRFDAATPLPPSLFGSGHRRLVPHIYTSEEMLALLSATRDLMPLKGLRPVTCRTVFGLLAATGLRISEALGLVRSDLDIEVGRVIIRESKLHKQRWVPIHSTVAEELQSYATFRDQMVPNPITDQFFIFDNGRRATQRGILYALNCLCRKLGWKPRGDYANHRLHDFRHTFIVRSVLRAYREGIDAHQSVLTLSTYVGHVKIADTYWYLTGIPELMQIASDRFRQFAHGGER